MTPSSHFFQRPEVGQSRATGQLLLAANACFLTLAYVRHGGGLASRSEPGPSTAAMALYLTTTLGTVLLATTLLGILLTRMRCFDTPRRVRLVLPATLATLLLLVFADMWSVRNLGVHALGGAPLRALLNPGAGRELRLPEGLGWLILLAWTGVAAVQYAVLVGLERLQLARRPAVRHLGRMGAGLGTAAAIVALGTSRGVAAGTDDVLVEAAPLAPLLFGGKAPDLTRATVTLPDPGSETLAARPTILFVLVESLRADMLSPEHMPALWALSEAQGCVRSQRHLSGAHTTEYGVFTLLFGLDAPAFDPIRDARPAIHSAPMGLLRRNGYRSVGASSSALRTWNDAGFLTREFDLYDEFTTTGGPEEDEAVLATITREAGAAKPQFLFAFLNATHHNYQYPPAFERHLPVIESTYDHFLDDEVLRSDGNAIKNRYLNAVGYVDDVIARMVAALAAERARGELILVISGDHGEEFWEHELLGHAAPRFIQERLEVPLVACGLGLAHPPVLSSHVDVWPTVLDRLGVDATAVVSGRVLGHAGEPEIAFVGGLDFPWGNRTAAVVTPTARHWLARCRDGSFPCVQVVRSVGLDDRSSADPPDPDLIKAVEQRLGRFVTVAAP